MGRYQALLDERAALTREGEEILALSDTENRALTAEEAERHDAILARLKAIGPELARIEAQREADRVVLSRRDRENGQATVVNITGVHDRREDDPRQGFATIVDFAQAVKRASRVGGEVDERLRFGAAPSNFFQEQGGDSGEGYLVPAEFRREIWAIVWADPLMERVNWEDTAATAVGLLADESTPWGATGVTARWRSEASQMTPQKFALQPRLTTLHQLYAFVLATDELLADAPLMRGRMREKAAEAIVWAVVEAIVTGTGAGQPYGILSHAATVNVAKETNQPGATVVAENVLKMYSRMIFSGGGAGPFWIANQDVLPQLPTMTIGTQPVWLPPTGLISSPNGGILLGRPLFLTDHAETLGTVGDLIFFNPAGYHAIRRAAAPDFQSSIHLYFDYGIEAFRWTFRVGGQPMLSAPVSPAKGSATRSHFVTLATRA